MCVGGCDSDHGTYFFKYSNYMDYVYYMYMPEVYNYVRLPVLRVHNRPTLRTLILCRHPPLSN